MRRIPALATAVVASLLVVPALLSPLPALARPAARALPAVVVPDADDDIPGVPLTDSPVAGSLSDLSDSDDVFAVSLLAGQTVTATLAGPASTSFALDLYGPKATSAVNGDQLPVASSHGDGYPQSLTYTARDAGTCYLDVSTWGGAGAYRLEWRVSRTSSLTLTRGDGPDRYRTVITAPAPRFLRLHRSGSMTLSMFLTEDALRDAFTGGAAVR